MLRKCLSPHNTTHLDTTPSTHSIPDLDSKTAAEYSEDINPQRDLVQLQDHLMQCQERLNQLGSTTGPPAHTKELAHFTEKLQQLAVTLQPHSTCRPIQEHIHTAMQQYTDTLCTTQWQTNLTTSLLEDIPHLMDGTPPS